MVNMEQQSRNAASTTLLYQLTDLWKSPRGIVLRIEALALVAIALSFLLVAFGSCRRWSNRWIIQKGFLIANVLSLSLGTYSIGLMQSSSVKSEMYPIWAVSLLALFGCVDPVTSYIGVDYRAPLSKVLFQLCLYCGYVLLMSNSTVASDIDNIAVCLLSVITFIKGFHRSMAFVLPRRLRIRIEALPENVRGMHGLSKDRHNMLMQAMDVDLGQVTMGEICSISNEKNGLFSIKLENEELSLDVCIAFSLSHFLHKRFLGLSEPIKEKGTFISNGVIDYVRAMKLIEIELAFLYDMFFTGNAFLHYHQATNASFWAFTSFIAICFVGVTVVAIPEIKGGRHTTSPGSGASTIVMDTTTVDLIISLVVLVSLALLQLVQLIWCWTSNWARVAFACKYAKYHTMTMVFHVIESSTMVMIRLWWMRLKGFIVTSRANRFENYLWQNKLGQHSLAAEWSRKGEFKLSGCITVVFGSCFVRKFYHLCWRLGLQYIGQVLRDLLGSNTSNESPVGLDDDVKSSLTDFLGQLKSDVIDEDWYSFLVENGAEKTDIPYTPAVSMPDAYHYTSCVMIWQIATSYCELAEQEEHEECKGCWGTAAAATACFRKAADHFPKEKKAAAGGEAEKNRRVAIVLSKYCSYLVVSAPELLPGSSASTKRVYDDVASVAKNAGGEAKDKLEVLQRLADRRDVGCFHRGVTLGQRLRLCSDPWKVLAHFWVRTLVYAAPYGNAEAHMQHLAQGGELITHLWSLLYHLGIDEWKHQSSDDERFQPTSI